MPFACGQEVAAYATLSTSPSPDISVVLGQPAVSVPRIAHNIRAASYCGERPVDRSFVLFPKLLPEIRLNIWRHALSVPRIIEIAFDKNWFYRSKTLPPLLSCNHESRIECLKAYSTYNDVISRWIRFDWDILYCKGLEFSKHRHFVKPGFECLSIQRWEPQEFERVTNQSDKWTKRPQHFEKVHALAVNREILTQTVDDYECIIRHFFPHLELLVVLIDDGIVIHKAWESNFKAYEGDWRELPPRGEFIKASTGPFTPVSKENAVYEEYVQRDMMKRFEKEKDDYVDYDAPFISVRGCWPPPGVEVPECGRWPDDWDGWVRTIQ